MFRENPNGHSYLLDKRDFAQRFRKYENDRNNFTLYIWGYVMLMIDYYETENLILTDQLANKVSTFYGEPDMYP